MFSDSSRAFRETSYIAVAWLRDTHHLVRVQEARLEQVEQHTRDQGREIHTNIADIGCIGWKDERGLSAAKREPCSLRTGD